MKLLTLPFRDKYWRNIEKEINRIFLEVIYRPLMATVADPTGEIINTSGILIDAITKGIIYWHDGHFSGDFNSTISKELRAIGAVYNGPSRTWSLVRELVPVDLRFAQASADSRFDSLRRGLLRTLDDINIDSISKISNSPENYAQSIDWMEEDFRKAVRGITIEVQLTDVQRNMIASQWGQNLDIYIKSWTEQNILKLRQDIQANTFAGRRSAEMIEMIKQNYGVSQRKARFLARQETSLLLSKFRETRSRDIGSKKYRWSTSHDERVRHDHKDLNGKIYFWDMPPVTNRKTGARNNPGEDFGCRCVAISIIE